MARQESSREDLIREATALVERVEFASQSADSGAHVVVGFRKGGAASFFFDDDPVYQFNADGHLRRAYCNGRLLKAERGELVSLDRIRQEGEVQLVRHQLDFGEREAVVDDVSDRLNELHRQLATGEISAIRCVPAEADLLARVLSWLEQGDPRTIADAPNVDG